MRHLQLLLFITFCLVVGCGGGTPAVDASVQDQGADDVADQVDVPTGSDGGVLDVVAPVDVPGSSDATDRPLVDAPDANACPDAGTRCGDTCVDLQGDPAHCGACDTNCRTLPGVASTVRCDHGACFVRDACASGFADCDGTPSNGCEVDLSRPASCGACGISCTGATPVCAMVNADGGVTRACTNGCTAPAPTRCSDTCVDTTSDVAHCGGCGQRCAVANAAPLCRGGRCGVDRCDVGFADCDGDVANGCEVDTRTSSAHCGTCGRACSSNPSSPALCVAGTCAPLCDAGFHRCGTTCVREDEASCGSSCTRCPTPAAGERAVCAAGSCTTACATGFHRCGDRCVSASSPESCGAACAPCAAPANAAATCEATALTCGFRCNAGFHVCGGTCASNTNVGSCGAACVPCPVPAHATAGCSSGGACTAACDPGYLDCNENMADGCEAHVTSCFTETDLFTEGFESTPSRWTLDPVWTWRYLVYPSARGTGHLLGQYASSTCAQTGTATIAQEFDLSRATAVSFTYYVQAEIGRSDAVTVQVSTDGGSTWEYAAYLSSSFLWSPQLVRLDTYAGSPRLRLRFTFQDICTDGVNARFRVDEIVLHARLRNF